MQVFTPEVHTAEALASELSVLHSNFPDARLVGSLGRSVIFGNLLGDPSYEFQRRGQEPLTVAGNARDIDVIGDSRLSLAGLNPFELDTDGYSNPYIDVVRDGDDWFLVGERHGFAEPIHPEVMEPVSGITVLDIEAVTLSPQTLVNIYGLKGYMREKDRRTKLMLQEAIERRADIPSYPDEFLEPFRVLSAMNRQSLYVRAQDTYRNLVPNSIRVKAVPLMGFLKRNVLKV